MVGAEPCSRFAQATANRLQRRGGQCGQAADGCRHLWRGHGHRRRQAGAVPGAGRHRHGRDRVNGTRPRRGTPRALPGARRGRRPDVDRAGRAGEPARAAGPGVALEPGGRRICRVRPRHSHVLAQRGAGVRARRPRQPGVHRGARRRTALDLRRHRQRHRRLPHGQGAALARARPPALHRHRAVSSAPATSRTWSPSGSRRSTASKPSSAPEPRSRMSGAVTARRPW